MSKWNDFCESVSKTTKKTADKTKNIANLASLRMKLNKLEVKVSEEYDSLGRIYYLQEVGKVDNREAIALQLRCISDINKQINAVKGEIREKKEAVGLFFVCISCFSVLIFGRECDKIKETNAKGSIK